MDICYLGITISKYHFICIRKTRTKSSLIFHGNFPDLPMYILSLIILEKNIDSDLILQLVQPLLGSEPLTDVEPMLTRIYVAMGLLPDT